LQAHAVKLVASLVVDSDRSAGILFKKFAGASERLMFSAEMLGADPLVNMRVTSCYGCRIPIENSIRHQFTPGLLKEKLRFGMYGNPLVRG
jgi:hypothetical protein